MSAADGKAVSAVAANLCVSESGSIVKVSSVVVSLVALGCGGGKDDAV